MEFNNYNLKRSKSLPNLKFQDKKMKTNSELKNKVR